MSLTGSFAQRACACPLCDMLLQESDLPGHRAVRCPRCGTGLRTRQENLLQRLLALSLAGLVLAVPAMTLPVMNFNLAGLQGSSSVLEAALVLLRGNEWGIGLMVLAFSVVFPVLQLGLLFCVSGSLLVGYSGFPVREILRLSGHVSEWAMPEIFLMGILVSIVKLHALGSLEFTAGFFCFSGLVLLTVSAGVAADKWWLWERFRNEPGAVNRMVDSDEGAETTSMAEGVLSCRECGLLVAGGGVPAAAGRMFCPRCHSVLEARRTSSVNTTWALVVTAAILFFPANLLPIMRVDFMGQPEEQTILQGIVYFFQSGDLLIGTILLVASVLVPLFKILGIAFLLCSIQFNRQGWLRHKTTLFRCIEFIGRWSFLDIFVIAVLASLVQFGPVMSISAHSAALYFSAVVLATMFAAQTLDARLLWDRHDPLEQTEG